MCVQMKFTVTCAVPSLPAASRSVTNKCSFLPWLGVSKQKLSCTALIDVSLPGFQRMSKHRYRSALLPVDSTNANRSAINVISWIASGRSTAAARRANES